MGDLWSSNIGWTYPGVSQQQQWTQTQQIQFTGNTTNAATYQIIYPDSFGIAPKAKEESALEWLDRRVDEMRVTL